MTPRIAQRSHQILGRDQPWRLGDLVELVEAPAEAGVRTGGAHRPPNPALGQILGGVQPDVALGLRTGDACRPPPSSDAIWWRRFLIRAGVQELIEDGTAKTKTAAFKRLAESRCYPDLTGTGADESIPWTRVRDIYYGHKQ